MPEYHYDQLGVVSELYPLQKAVITFQLDGRGPEQRALLWGRRFVCKDGHQLAETQSIETVLEVGDEVIFDCHIYDNENNQDACSWYVARAESAAQPEHLSDFVSNVMARVEEVGQRRAFALFKQPGRTEPQRAVFVVARFFDHGKRLPADSSLRHHLVEDQVVHLDAQYYGRSQLQGAQWYAPLAWRGQKPEVELDRQPPMEVLAGEDEPAHRPAPTLSDNLFPALSSADSRAALRRPQCEDKWGYVASLLNAEYGVLLWQATPRQYQSVLFHRSVAHLFDLNLKNYDLRTIFKKGDHLRFEAEPSEHPETYRWKAYSVWLES